LAIVKPEWIEIEGEGGVITREKWPKRSTVVTGSRDHSLRVWSLPRPGEPEYRCYGADDTEADPADVCFIIPLWQSRFLIFVYFIGGRRR
jgi:F-box and WD-40 domain protein CDC4